MNKRLIYRALIVGFLLFNSLIGVSQVFEGFDFNKQLWTGLRMPQVESELPKGNAPFQVPVRVAKQNIATVLKEQLTGEWQITKGWELIDEEQLILSQKSAFDPALNTDNWYNATVPGTVLTTLVDQGVYPDPYFGLNNMNIPESLNKMNWWYRCKFELPAKADNGRLHLIFNGINYASEIYLNGKKLGTTKGAFIRGEFDVTDIAKKDGENILAVRVFPPSNPGLPHEQSMIAGQGLNGGMLSEDGPTFISSMGWDWIPGIRDRNTGIWQDVLLKNVGSTRLGDPLVTTHLLLPDTTQARINVLVPVKNLTKSAVSGKVTANIEGIMISKLYTLAANEGKEILLSSDEFKELNIKNPRLWWPNGYGNPELYNLELTTDVNGKLSDTKKLTFGIREMSYELMIAKKENNYARINYTPNHTKVKGKPVFDYINRVTFEEGNDLPTLLKDADTSGIEYIDNNDPVGPYLVIKVNGQRIFTRGGNWGMDDGMKRVDRDRLEPYFKLHREANMNIIRNWTGESTEEAFYQLADEYGMLVWNDFWITTDDTVEPNDFPLFLDNARDAVKRFRNHPSIAVWCPRNEGFAPYHLGLMLADMIAKEDPTRHYHGQSRHLNMGTSGPWGYFKDPSKYYTENAKGMNTELGNFAIPTAETIKKFIAPEDQWPINDVWAYHDMHHTTQNFEDFMAAVYRYGEPKSMEEFSKQSQFVTYESWRYMLEAWNSKMWNNTTGLILWMSHPAWPSFIWQSYTYDYETPGSYFGIQKACEPIHIQMNLPKYEVITVNTTLKEQKNVTASVRYIDLDGKVLHQSSKKVNMKANGIEKCFEPASVANLPKMYLVRLELKDNKGKVITHNDYWMTDGKAASYQEINNLPQADVKTTLRKTNKGELFVDVKNGNETIATNIKLNVVDKKTGASVLPAYFSNGYFNLLKGESKTVKLTLPNGFSDDYEIAIDGYNL